MKPLKKKGWRPTCSILRMGKFLLKVLGTSGVLWDKRVSKLYTIRQLVYVALIMSAGVWTSEALAQIKHLVLDLENTLIQQIPKRNFQVFTQKSQMFSASRGYYYIHWQGKEWINELLKREDIILSITSDQDLSNTQAILDAIDSKLRAKISDGLGVILTLEDKVNGVHNLRKITSDLANVIYISHYPEKVKVDQKIRVLDLGPSFYKYESWPAADGAKAQVADSEKFHFPNDEGSWKIDSYKIPLLARVFKKRLFTSDVTVLKKELLMDVDRSIPLSQAYLEGKTSLPLWTYGPDKSLIGCETVDVISEKSTKNPIEECLSVLPITIEWKIHPNGDKVNSCQVKDSSGSLSKELPVNVCLSDSLKKFWEGQTQTNCAYYTEDLIFIADAPQGDCDKRHVLKNPKTRKNQVVTFYVGMENATLEEIFSRLATRSLSFRASLLDNKIDNIDNSLLPKCLSAVREVYDNGHDFSLDIIKKYIVPLDSIKFISGVNDRIFYHYTNFAGVSSVVQRNKFIEMFTYVQSFYLKNWWNYLVYAAEDPMSSSHYGKYQLKIHMKPETQVLVEFKADSPAILRDQVITNIIAKYPKTIACFPSRNGLSFNPNNGDLNLYYLAAEDSGADIIQYWNAWNTVYYSHVNDYQYFQILHPDTVEKIEIGIPKKL
jgi:hypothetical protein